MQVGVTYTDRNTLWAEWADRASLPLVGVLFVVVTRERGEKAGLVSRLWPRTMRHLRDGRPWHGTDYYALGEYQGQWFATQWDEEDWDVTLRAFDGPERQVVTWRPPFPADADIVVFEGAILSSVAWAEALELLESLY